jgi:hypothetical protein
MARVTLEGSITPSTFLRRGRRITVERTPYIEKLIRGGYVVVVPDPPAAEEVEAIVAEPRERADDEQRIPDTPARNASRAEWAAFLEGNGIPYAEDDTRADLIARWDDAEASADGVAVD